MNTRNFFALSAASLIDLLLLNAYQDHRSAIRATWNNPEVPTFSAGVGEELSDILDLVDSSSARAMKAGRRSLRESTVVTPPEPVKCHPVIYRVILAYNPELRDSGAARYLSWQLRRWSAHEDMVERALASYNAGPGAVTRYGGIPPYGCPDCIHCGVGWCPQL